MIVENKINVWLPILVTIMLVCTIIGCIATGCSFVAKSLEYTRDYLESNPEVAQKIFDEAVRAYEKAKAECDKNRPQNEKDNEIIQSVCEDEVQYSELIWAFGGFNGAGASRDLNLKIGNYRTEKNRIHYSWLKGNMSSWGAKHDHDSDYSLACFFVKDNSGKWVGGKFDWISQDRLFRDLDHLYGEPTGYRGWSLANVPNPTESAFVIVGWRNGKRSNVIKGTWTR